MFEALPGETAAMVVRNVSPGVHRIEDAFTNWYLIEADEGITIVDCGVPSSWESLRTALGAASMPCVRSSSRTPTSTTSGSPSARGAS